MAVAAVAEMVSAMKKVEAGVLFAEQQAASERELRKAMEARTAEAEAKALAAEAAAARHRQECEEWKERAERRQGEARDAGERLESAQRAQQRLELQLAEAQAVADGALAAQRGLEAEVERYRRQLQEYGVGWGKREPLQARRWGTAEWWADGPARVGAPGHNYGTLSTPLSQDSQPTDPAAAGGEPAEDVTAVGAGGSRALEEAMAAAARERRRLAEEIGTRTPPSG